MVKFFVFVLMIRRHEIKNVAGHVAFLYNRCVLLDEQALIQDENLKLYQAFVKSFKIHFWIALFFYL
ncbi:hypothetical protein BCL90_3010 [Pedobacter alluvionis]|uniref:Uncharacterized protein n=1 Tax=Pedobacter alluvionis TaxID=475253 RepID=A0A497XZQ6_9SPHI|nr:hypothetical protein BCL90_3010 [Pedobacter alluvionis]